MTRFEQDRQVNKMVNFNGRPMPYWKYALAVHKRDIQLYSKGIIPTRGWKITPFKEYYGLKGRDRQALVDQFLKIFQENFYA